MTVAEKLDAAADLLARPGGWTQGAYARKAHGAQCDWMDADAVCFCAVGALRRGGPAAEPCIVLNEVVGRFLPDWNDHPQRTQDEVVAAFRKAADLARERGL